MAKFSIATNFDSDFLKEIGRLNKEYSPSKIIEVFGSLPVSLTGSGRHPSGLPNISAHDFADHIKQVHGLELEFNYLMNSPRPGNFYDIEWRKRLDQFIDYLRKIGVDSITIADESLVRYVKKRFQDIPVHVSLITGIDTLKKAKRFSDIGVRLISLNQHTINRNMNRIKEIVDAVNCQIRLYANISCLQDCPKRKKHYIWLGSQSKEGSINWDRQVDDFLLWCEKEYMEKPVELLRSPFIRPEGLELYEEIGVDSFKLSDRREPTGALVKLLEAYMSGEYHGNLFSLLFREDRKWTNAVRHIFNVESLGHTAIAIDNDKLTELDFDRKVVTLSGDELREFYQLATSKVVSGVSDSRTRKFHKSLQEAKKYDK